MQSTYTTATALLARAAFGRSAGSLLRAAADPAGTQRRLLDDLAARCSRSLYGAAHGIRTADDFLTRLPVVNYADLEPFIDQQRNAERGTLVAERVLFYEKTSGSSGPAKYIPYTASLRRSFTRMFAVWAHDLLRHGPRFRTGKFYFSVSPNFGRERFTERGVPVGLDDDADYLGPWLKRAMSPFFVVPKGASTAPDANTWKRCVGRALVAQADLEIISVWNPSMLLVLLDTIEEHRRDFAQALAFDPRRSALEGGQVDWAALWPELKLVSCWTSAGAAPLARALEQRLPFAMVQGKGLLATEAPLTVPLLSVNGFLPMLDEVFFELDDVEAGRLVLIHEAVLGRTYELVISQKGGLCRYRMGDRVRVTHFHGGTPCLEFVGRGRDTSDLVGEKLQEGFVAEALRDLLTSPGGFWSLIPTRQPQEHYVLVLDYAPADPGDLELRVDTALRRAHHYHHARSLGQLGPVRVVTRADAADVLRDYELSRGMKWGDIKHRLLFNEPADELIRTLAPARERES